MRKYAIQCMLSLNVLLLPDLGVYYFANDGTIWLFLHFCLGGQGKERTLYKILVECIFVSH